MVSLMLLKKNKVVANVMLKDSVIVSLIAQIWVCFCFFRLQLCNLFGTFKKNLRGDLADIFRK